MRAEFLFLGTGGSLGVPLLGCSCHVCTSQSAYNKRLRPSGLLTVGGKRFLIDVGPDFRQQALRAGLCQIEGLLFTHAHFDHIGGVDDLRALYFSRRAHLHCLLSKATFEEIQARYHYLVNAEYLKWHLLPEEEGVIDFQGVSLSYLAYSQMGMPVTGYRYGDFSYVSDIRDYSEKALLLALKGTRVLVVSAVRHDPSPSHFNVEEACAFARKVGAEQTWITHIAHELDHKEVNKTLPPDIQLSYDGQHLVLCS